MNMKMKLLTAAVAALATGLAHNAVAATAATGVTPTIPSATFSLNLAGSSAQDTAIKTILNTDLCVVNGSSTLKIFQDNYGGTSSTTNWGGRWAAYYCTLNSTTAPTALQGQTIVINKRSAGGSGYGVLSIVNSGKHTPFAINFMNVGTSNCTMQDTTQSIPTYGCLSNEAYSIGGGTTTTGATNVFQAIPDAGVADTNPALFTGVNQVLDFGKSVTAGDVASLTVTPAAALTFSVPVTLDLYIALQDAQGLLANSSCTAGAYGYTGAVDSCMPSLSRNQMTALITGNVQTWSQLSFDNGATALTSHTTHTINGAPGDQYVHFVQRTAGSGTAATQYARFLNAPCSGNGGLAPTADQVQNGNGGPAVHSVYETADMEAGLDDLQNGTTVVTDYLSGTSLNGGVKAWAFGQISADKNVVASNGTYSHGYRMIKIDGYAPTLQNTYNGTYPVWAESSWVVNKNDSATKPTGSKLALINYLIGQATTSNILKAADKAQAFGTSGYLGLPDNNPTLVANTLSFTTPTMPASYPNGDNCQVPVPYSNNSNLTFK